MEEKKVLVNEFVMCEIIGKTGELQLVKSSEWFSSNEHLLSIYKIGIVNVTSYIIKENCQRYEKLFCGSIPLPLWWKLVRKYNLYENINFKQTFCRLCLVHRAQ